MDLKLILERLNADAQALCSPHLHMQMRWATEAEAISLRTAILTFAGLLDDSISSPGLGSLFDLTDDTPLNSMRRGIASAYGVKETIAGTNGTSGLNTPAVMSCAGEGQLIAVSRDAHVSI